MSFILLVAFLVSVIGTFKFMTLKLKTTFNFNFLKGFNLYFFKIFEIDRQTGVSYIIIFVLAHYIRNLLHMNLSKKIEFFYVGIVLLILRACVYSLIYSSLNFLLLDFLALLFFVSQFLSLLEYKKEEGFAHGKIEEYLKDSIRLENYGFKNGTITEEKPFNRDAYCIAQIGNSCPYLFDNLKITVNFTNDVLDPEKIAIIDSQIEKLFRITKISSNKLTILTNLAPFEHRRKIFVPKNIFKDPLNEKELIESIEVEYYDYKIKLYSDL